jgi:hypothetical protein
MTYVILTSDCLLGGEIDFQPVFDRIQLTSDHKKITPEVIEVRIAQFPPLHESVLPKSHIGIERIASYLRVYEQLISGKG